MQIICISLLRHENGLSDRKKILKGVNIKIAKIFHESELRPTTKRECLHHTKLHGCYIFYILKYILMNKRYITKNKFDVTHVSYTTKKLKIQIHLSEFVKLS